MAKSKHPNFGGFTPPDLNSTTVGNLPLAWDWRFRKIDGNSLREFAKYIHWMIECEHDQAGRSGRSICRNWSRRLATNLSE